MNTSVRPVLSDIKPLGDVKSNVVSSDAGRFDRLYDQLVQDPPAADTPAMVEEVGAGLVNQMLGQLFPSVAPSTTQADPDLVPPPFLKIPQEGGWEQAQVNPDARRGPVNPVQSVLDAPVPEAVATGRPVGSQQSPPFQIFLDKALDFFLRVSDLERKSDFLMGEYVQGKVSLDELMVDKAKVGIALSFTLTLFNQVSQALKDIQNLQV